MTPKELEEAGKRLYGDKWKSPMARAVGVERTTVARWAKDDGVVPAYVELAIEALKQRKVEELTR